MGEKLYRLYDGGPSIINYVAKKKELEKIEKLGLISILNLSKKEIEEKYGGVYWIGPGNKSINLYHQKTKKDTTNKSKRYIEEKDRNFLCHNYFYEWKGKIIDFEYDVFQKGMLYPIRLKKSSQNKDLAFEYIFDRGLFEQKNGYIKIDFCVFKKIFNCISFGDYNEWFLKGKSKTINYENEEQVKFIQDEIIKYGLMEKIPSFPGETQFDYKWWVFRGWDEEYGKEIVRKIQSRNSRMRKTSPNPYEIKFQRERYGLTEEEAIEKIIQLKRNSSCTLETFIKKYGEEKGREKYKEKREHWIKTMSEKSNEEKLEILKKKTQNLICCSAISQKLFDDVYKRIKKLKIKCYYGKLNHEYGIFCHALKKGVLFDFVIPELKFAIEYNGSRFHPNKDVLTEEEWQKWSNPFTKKSADEVFEHDCLKNSSLIKKGFDLMIIWDTEYLKNERGTVTKIVDVINKKYNELKSSRY